MRKMRAFDSGKGHIEIELTFWETVNPQKIRCSATDFLFCLRQKRAQGPAIRAQQNSREKQKKEAHPCG